MLNLKWVCYCAGINILRALSLQNGKTLHPRALFHKTIRLKYAHFMYYLHCLHIPTKICTFCDKDKGKYRRHAVILLHGIGKTAGQQKTCVFATK